MKTIGILGLSNPCSIERVQPTIDWLKECGHTVIESPLLYIESTGQERAAIFNSMMKEDFDYIFDVSGGDLANECVTFLDLDVYKKSTTIFHGYSDLTCVLNVLAPIRSCVLFQICGNTNKRDIQNYLDGKENDLFVLSAMGGNIRCLLKLAGTSYFPDLNHQTLFLESRSGDAYRIRTFLTQLDMMGVFDQVKDVCIGQFTQLGDDTILKDFFRNKSVQVTYQYPVGHSKDSKAIWIERK